MKTHAVNWRDRYRETFKLLSLSQQLRVLWWAFWGTKEFKRFVLAVQFGVAASCAYKRARIKFKS